MKKFINMHVLATYNADGKNQSIVQIIEQSHRGMKFGNNSDTFKAKNGVILTSESFPEYYGTSIYVRGDKTGKDNLPMTLDTATKEKVWAAIREYCNFNFQDEDKNADNKVMKLVNTLDFGCQQDAVKKLVGGLLDEIEAVKCAGMYK